MNLKSIPFFSDDIAIMPHSTSPEFKSALVSASPITVGDVARRFGQPIALYESSAGELRLEVKPRHAQGHPIFIEGPEAA